MEAEAEGRGGRGIGGVEFWRQGSEDTLKSGKYLSVQVLFWLSVFFACICHCYKVSIALQSEPHSKISRLNASKFSDVHYLRSCSTVMLFFSYVSDVFFLRI